MKSTSRFGLTAACLGLSFLLSGCNQAPSTDEKQADQQEHTLAQAANEIGMPALPNMQEKRMLKEVLELRDQAITTTTYFMDMNGHLHKLCDSIGYGIPAATQYTNPQRAEWVANHGYITLPQADPNGLFSPASAEGTWVKCIDPKTKNSKVVYAEPRVVTSPFELDVK